MQHLLCSVRPGVRVGLTIARGVSLAVGLGCSLYLGTASLVAGDDNPAAETRAGSRETSASRSEERGGSRESTRRNGSRTSKAEGDSPAAGLSAKPFSTGYAGQYGDLIGFINEQVRKGWAENGMVPSGPAVDGEWLRRVHLDLVGHIPDLETTEAFVADKSPDKRFKVIENLLNDPGYVRHFTTIWTNLLIGRATPQNISRPALQKFLRNSFGKNRGWDKIVVDLLTAEGHYEENGATNFLLSHLNEGAVPATALSARLFLGIQVQCTQCHNHPFNDWKQNSFWEFNSFFKQAQRVEHREYNEKTGRMDFSYFELTRADFEGPVFFERRNGVMEVAYPKYNGVEVSPEGSIDRRKELASIIVSGEKTQLAEAAVNRMWGHLFGYGFTRPVDDMGPHKVPSHPELLAGPRVCEIGLRSEAVGPLDLQF